MEFTFDSRKQPFVRLEAADLLAHEAMKEFDRKLTRARPEPRTSYRTLAEAKNGQKFIWIEYDRAHCKQWREQIESEEGRKDYAEYKDWLIRTRRVQNGIPHDNHANRFMFYAWIENRDSLVRHRALKPQSR